MFKLLRKWLFLKFSLAVLTPYNEMMVTTSNLFNGSLRFNHAIKSNSWKTRFTKIFGQSSLFG